MLKMKAHAKIHFDDSWKKAAFMERLTWLYFFWENCDYLLKNTNDGDWGRQFFDWTLRG